MIFLGWGVLVSSGLAGGIAPAIMGVQKHFQKYKGLAVGTAMSGFGLGTFTLAAVSEDLITSLGWRKAALLLGVATVASYAAAAWAVGKDAKTPAEQDFGAPQKRVEGLDIRGPVGASSAQEEGSPPKGVSLRLLKGSSKNPEDPGFGRWRVTDPELATLKRVRDKLSFVIFALSAKAHHNLSFSADEAAGCKEMLTHLAKELVEISMVLEKRGTRSVQEEIRSRVETPP